ncbi:MFS general substrate transporter [Sistotremastrum niveocremeum HHB9708]|uniref:MFS general substrate transporter n=1 Tax=Sistotremastrum niveocremeum HHB9708 TaxID=1314777 RepID=A0A164T7U2_9AGAM|nr:MFS general substrate transporter [Sistotremastrum niveocremeum HHB9708]
MFTNLGHANAFGVYESYYERVYLSHESSSTISWIGSVQISCLFVFGLITGPLFDAGKFRHIMIGSTILLTFCNLMLSFAKPDAFYQIFLSQGIGMGLAMGATYSPSYAICSHHFRRKRGFAMGLVASGGAVGGLIQPIMLNHLLNERGLSFGNAIRINTAMNGFLFVVANFLMKTKHAAVGGVKKSPVGGRGRMMMRFMTQPAYLSVTLGLIFNLFGLFFPVIYLQLLSTTKGLPENFSFYSISILNGVSAFGRILPNLLSDRFGAFNMFIPFTFATGLILLSILAVNSIAGVVSVAIFYGFFSGAYIALSSAVLASLADHDGEIGARIGLASAFSAISSVAGPPINGVLLGSSFNWTPPILFSGVRLFPSG